MGQYTNTYNRFKGRTGGGCSCIFCYLYDVGKKRCPRSQCCCERERAQAICREQLGEGGIPL